MNEHRLLPTSHGAGRPTGMIIEEDVIALRLPQMGLDHPDGR